jgi:arsenate reductase
MLKIYGIKHCETMKKAFAWLDGHGLAYAFVDYRQAGVIEAHLPDWIVRGGDKRLLNTRGLTWRRLSASDRADVDADKAQRLMRQYPTLIRRPVLDTGRILLVGFDHEQYAEALL